jgi:hypothetical protein
MVGVSKIKKQQNPSAFMSISSYVTA